MSSGQQSTETKSIAGAAGPGPGNLTIGPREGTPFSLHQPISQKGLVPAALVLITAFFLASTPVRNSDFWLHLATGKALVEGRYQFGVEPFTARERWDRLADQEDAVSEQISVGSGEAPAYWANPAWLYDLMLFLLFHSLGGTVLVVLKGLGIAFLGWFMIASCQTGRSFVWSSLSVSLALVVIGPWLSLKPVCISLLLFGWTIWYLERKLRLGQDRLSLMSFWPMLVVFALWANLDHWFFLGPLTVGFFFLGSIRQSAIGNRQSAESRKPKADGRKQGSSRLLGMLFALGLAVCACNPHHFQLWAVPFQMIDSAAAQVGQDPFLRPLASPFRDTYFSWHFFHNVPGLALWLLATLSLGSFFLNFAACPWRWLLSWCFLFLLSLWQTQALPFFAIVSGPILACNLGAFFSSRPSRMAYGRARFSAGHAFAWAVLFALPLAAWPGWLGLGPYGPRDWRVNLDPAIGQIGEQLSLWHQERKTPRAAMVFPFNPETGNYLAWLCPDIPSFVNGHLHLSEKQVGDFLAVRQGLTGVTAPGTPKRDWRNVVRQGHMRLLLIHGNDQPTMAAMKNLYSAYRECPLLTFKGKGAIFGWRDLERDPRTDPFAALRLDLTREAFSFSKQPPAVASPIRPPVPLHWWDAFWRPRYSPSVNQDEAATLLTFFDGAMPEQTKKNYYRGQAILLAELASRAAMPIPANWNNFFLSIMNLMPPLNDKLANGFLQDQDEGPVAALYLAVRAGRRALQDNPDDARAAFLLGEAYFKLARHTREGNWTAVLADFRSPQALGAYQRVLTLNPGNFRTHERMAELFQAMKYKDLTLQHMAEVYRIRKVGPAPGESLDQFNERIGKIRNTMQTLKEEVQALQDRLAINSANLRVADRAKLAARYGLSGTALATLLKSDIAAFGASGLELELNLLLRTGQLENVTDWLDPKHIEFLGPTAYLLIQAQLDAGLGNYRQAERALRDLIVAQIPGGKKLRPNQMLVVEIGKSILYEAGGGPLKLFPVPVAKAAAGKDALPQQMSSVLFYADREALSLIVQGVLALEAGANKEARGYFREALAFWTSPAGSSFTNWRSLTGKQMARYFLGYLAKANP
jgi:tetratricopeptide (TPR) repeat protein